MCSDGTRRCTETTFLKEKYKDMCNHTVRSESSSELVGWVAGRLLIGASTLMIGRTICSNLAR